MNAKTKTPREDRQGAKELEEEADRLGDALGIRRQRPDGTGGIGGLVRRPAVMTIDPGTDRALQPAFSAYTFTLAA